jgi:hypothetical protein
VDNRAQNARVREIGQLVWARMDRLDHGIRVRQEQGFDAARDTIASGLGKQEMDALRDAVVRTTLEEEALLASASAWPSAATGSPSAPASVSALAALGAVAALLLLLRRLPARAGGGDGRARRPCRAAEDHLRQHRRRRHHDRHRRPGDEHEFGRETLTGWPLAKPRGSRSRPCFGSSTRRRGQAGRQPGRAGAGRRR